MIGRRTLAANLTLAVVALVLAFAIPEVILRALRPRIAHDLFATAGEHLPGLQGLVAETQRYVRARGIREPPNFLVPSDLLWSLRPGYDETITRLPWVEGEKRTFRVRVNAMGLRGADVAREKAPGTLRVICLGDSITFGDKIDQGETIPEDLARILATGSGRPVEVVNAGIPGYSSRQGLAMWRGTLRDLRPDIITIAFGFNDQWPSAVADADHFPPDVPLLGDAIGWLRRTETYRTLRALILAARRRVEHAPAAAGPTGTRVSLPRMRANVRAIAREARAAGARVVIVHTAVGRDDVRDALARAARDEGVPFVDAAGALARERDARQRALAQRLGLSGRCSSPPDAANAGFLFRVILPPAIPRQGPLLARVFGDTGPVVLPLSDDGRSCDERAGDGVWTGFLAARPGAVVHVLYVQTLPGGGEIQEFDAFPWAWRTRAAAPRGGPATSRPIDTWNRFDLMSEEIHPDAKGSAVMARAIAGAIGGGS